MSRRPFLSLCMIVRDEAASLGRCLASVAGVVDEVICVDTGSTDDTAALARAHGARVGSFAWSDDFAAARNAALGLARSSWVLSLDADEVLAEDDAPCLRATLAATHAAALRLPIRNVGVRGEVASVHCAVRVFRRQAAHRWTGAIHEQVAVGTAADAPIAIVHHGYAEVDGLRRKLTRNLALLEQRQAAAPGDAGVAFYVAQTRLALDDADGAIAVAESALSGERLDAPLTLLLLDVVAVARAASGRTEAAMDACRLALALRPEWIDPRLLLGQLCRRAGRGREAIVHLGRYLVDRERLAADPTWPLRLPRLRTLGDEACARAELAMVHAGLGDVRRARREVTRAVALAPGDPTATALLQRLDANAE